MVVFDMAGTTVEDDKIVEGCLAQACAETGLNVSQERLLAVQGWKKSHVMEIFWQDQLGPDHPDLKAKAAHSYKRFREILEDWYEEHGAKPTEGTLETFDWLHKKGIKIALTTGFYREVTDIILRKLGWDQGLDETYVGNENTLIQVSISSDQVPNGRPAPDLIFRAMDLLAVEDSKNVICVGDTPSDLGCGKAANCLLTLGVTNGTHTRQQLEHLPNDGLLGSIKEIPEVVGAYV